MSRDIGRNLSKLVDDPVVYPFFAVEMFFDRDQTLRLWTGMGELEVDGNTYFGTGNILNVTDIEETAEISAKGATLTLQGAPTEVVSLALSEQYQGRVCKIYFGAISKDAASEFLLQENGDYLLQEDGDKIKLSGGDVYYQTEIFSGYMDTMDILDEGESSTIELTVLNKLVDLERPRVARYTSAYQKYRYGKDLGLDFVESLQDKAIYWGRAGAS